jgi:hypothetical protein
MFTAIKMLAGCIFAIGMGVFSILKMKTYGKVPAIMTAVTCAIAAVIFLGQFVAAIGG